MTWIRMLVGPWRDSFEPKSIVFGISGRKVSEFGTVRPRVQIPGPRPKPEYDPDVTAGAGRAPYHSRITIPPDFPGRHSPSNQDSNGSPSARQPSYRGLPTDPRLTSRPRRFGAAPPAG